uniref:peptidylprolyl isomerase n=1 Tax=Chromera velia CCMP2878 TaxID=1169474 RepID=A0A0G4FKP0_9ALVE|eukprot:Cvel_3423.t1-p1 / transcript=Cvel_3423.t1 / gene=Cvel_3423 / organism=Chromera_velia_CCMP2878 / gene_product=hypothetical protein / transcript_product=hypothetical protein / location=Cvel_scaffold137:106555-110914(-) / protein_length=470 / sequence_SO=supercontig / SO=protein_coding / is_pseudo=false
MIAPVVREPMVHRLLHSFMKDSQKSGSTFADSFQPSTPIYQLMQTYAEEFKTNPDHARQIAKQWTESMGRAAEETVKAAETASAKTKEVDRTQAEGADGSPLEEAPSAETTDEPAPPQREEWVPGLSKGKRKLSPHELVGHFQLGEEMKASGRAAYEKGEFEMALTRYTQGVELLNWVEGTNDEDTQRVQEMLGLFHRNRAQAALKVDNWHEAHKAASEALSIDETDEKARYRRAKAAYSLGRMEGALEDYRWILANSKDKASIDAARSGYAETLKAQQKDRENVKKLMGQAASKGLFSEERPKPGTEEEIVAEAAALEKRRAEKERRERAAEPSYLPVEKKAGGGEGDAPSTPYSASAEPRLSLEETTTLLTELRDLYKSDDFEKQLREIRKAADYDQRRILIRLRKVMPETQTPVLRKWGFVQEEYAEMKKDLDRIVGFWSARDETVRGLSKDLMATVMGDFWGEEAS